MARNSLKIIINSIYKGDKNADRAKRAVNKLGDVARSAKDRFDSFSESLTKTKKGLASIGIAVGSSGLILKKAFDFGQQGAELLSIEQKFDRLAGTIGTTGEALEKELFPAMGGLVSRSEAMKSASELISLGLVSNQEEAIRLASVAGQLDMNMNQLVLTLTNQTTMRFDSLGISVDGFKEKVADLEDQGMDTNAAFKEAFLQQAEDQVEKVGEATEYATAEFKQLESNIKDFGDGVKKGLAPIIGGLVSGLNDIFDGMEAVSGAVDDQRERLEEGEISWEQYTSSVDAANKGVMGAPAIFQAFGDVLFEGKNKSEALQEALYGMTEMEYLVQQAAREMGVELDGAARETDDLKDSTEDLVLAQEEAKTQLDSLSQSMSTDLTGSFQDFQEEHEELTDKAENLKNKISELESKSWLSADQKEQLSDMRGELEETEEKIGDVTDAWDDQTDKMLFDLATQQFAIDGFTQDEIDALIELAGPRGLDMVDQAWVDLGHTVTDYGQQLSDHQIGLEEYIGKMDDLDGKVDDAGGSIDDIMSSSDDAQSSIDGLGGSADTAADKFASAADKARKFHDKILAIPDSKTFTLNLLKAGAEFAGALPPGMAGGGQFVVPQGFPNDSFPLRVQSGERVTVETPQQQRKGNDAAVLAKLDQLNTKLGILPDAIRDSVLMVAQ